MRALIPLVPWLLVVGSCASPPQPPTVDPAARRPVNTTDAVNLQACQGELRNVRLLATESGRRAEIAGVNVQRLLARQQAVDARSGDSCKGAANAVFTLLFDFASTRVVVPPDLSATLVEAALASPLILLRGRTDGTADSLAEGRIARGRAAGVRDWLIAAGVSPSRIRMTYQASGDFAADNANPRGQRLNRRVEIEVYRTLPLRASTAAATRTQDAG